VPPYGYGKSHGLAGVVRLLAFPPLHALEGEADVRNFVRCVFFCGQLLVVCVGGGRVRMMMMIMMVVVMMMMILSSWLTG
jgi:hypothetical protein